MLLQLTLLILEIAMMECGADALGLFHAIIKHAILTTAVASVNVLV